MSWMSWMMRGFLLLQGVGGIELYLPASVLCLIGEGEVIYGSRKSGV